MIGSVLRGVLGAGTSKYAMRGVAGYGIMKGGGYVADQLDSGVGQTQVGYGITGLLRGASTIAGGAMMGTAAIRGAGRLGMTGAVRARAAGAPGQGLLFGAAKKMNQFSVGNYGAKLAFGGIGVGKFKTPKATIFGKQIPGAAASLGKGAFSMGRGVAMAAPVLARDIAAGVGAIGRKAGVGKMLGAAGASVGRGARAGAMMGAMRFPRTANALAGPASAAMGAGQMVGAGASGANNWLKGRWGARMFGLGATAGAFKLATEVGAEQYGMSDGRGMAEYNQQRAADGYPTNVGMSQGRGMSFAGQQMYDPITGQKPRRMGSGGGAGLVQSLHKLR